MQAGLTGALKAPGAYLGSAHMVIYPLAGLVYLFTEKDMEL
ncbi:unnamed protein product [marine sediment metagenome]|uniref:Uncharacterized protein n=1 Tax=marine sediment metagenome TaxID=412755 RepID=X1IRM0_9ZZZZ